MCCGTYSGEFEYVESGVESFVSDESTSGFEGFEPNDGGLAEFGVQAAGEHVWLVAGELDGSDFLGVQGFGLLECAAELDDASGIEDLDFDGEGFHSSFACCLQKSAPGPWPFFRLHR